LTLREDLGQMMLILSSTHDLGDASYSLSIFLEANPALAFLDHEPLQ